MSVTDNLPDYLTSIANAIRTKTGSSELINAQDFKTAIRNIPSVTPTLHELTLSINESILSIFNPITNGNFVTGYKIYSDGSLLTTTTLSTLDLSLLLVTPGTYVITATAYGTNFTDSNYSNSVSYSSSQRLQTPITSIYGAGFTIEEVTGATSYNIYVDGSNTPSASIQQIELTPFLLNDTPTSYCFNISYPYDTILSYLTGLTYEEAEIGHSLLAWTVIDGRQIPSIFAWTVDLSGKTIYTISVAGEDTDVGIPVWSSADEDDLELPLPRGWQFQNMVNDTYTVVQYPTQITQFNATSTSWNGVFIGKSIS